MTTNTTDTLPLADSLEAQAKELELTAHRLRREASRLREAESSALQSTLLSIDDAVAASGLTRFAVRQFLDDGLLNEVRVGRRRLVVRSSLQTLGEAAS